MPRSIGLRDDDTLGRLAEIETRLDALEMGRDAPAGRTTDALRVPERDEKLRYASDFMIGVPTPGGGKPKVKYIREVVAE